jgi:hypothetical protein
MRVPRVAADTLGNAALMLAGLADSDKVSGRVTILSPPSEPEELSVICEPIKAEVDAGLAPGGRISALSSIFD